MPRQDSTTDQLHDLLKLAHKHGLYDAADFVLRAVEHSQENLERARDAKPSKQPRP